MFLDIFLHFKNVDNLDDYVVPTNFDEYFRKGMDFNE